MLNRVILMGRITRDLELRQTPSGVSALSFTVAVERSCQKQGEERQTDFIDCVAWRQNAEFISRYFGKGRLIALEGQLRTRSYDDRNGAKRYVTEVYVDSVSFTGESKPAGNQQEYGIRYEYRRELPASGSADKKLDRDPELEALGILSDDGVPF